MERSPGGPRGPSSKLTDAMRQDVRNWIAKQADLTLAELQVRLYEHWDLEISLSRLWMVLPQMGLRLKKSRSTPPSKIRLQASASAASGGKKRAGSIRRS
jgi:transposase